MPATQIPALPHATVHSGVARSHAMIALHALPRPGGQAWSAYEIGEYRCALRFFKLEISTPGALVRGYRQRARTYLAQMDRLLADNGPAWINTMLDAAWGAGRTKWLVQMIRLMQEVAPADCPSALPARLVALGLPMAAARTFFTFTAFGREPDLRHHAIALFARMDHATRARLLLAANFPAERACKIADAFAAKMLGDTLAPLQTAALLMVLALKPTPRHLTTLVDERFAAPLLDGVIESSPRYDEAEAFMQDPLCRTAAVSWVTKSLHSANPARHVELLGNYLAPHDRMPTGFTDLLGNYLRQIAGDTELPDETTIRTIVRGEARRLIGPDATSAVRQAMGKTSTERLGALLRHGIAVDMPDAHGFTALHYAIAVLDTEKVRLLLEHSADPLRKPVGMLHKLSDTLRKLGGTLHGLPPHKPLKFAKKLFERLDSPVQRARLTEIIDLLKTHAAHIRQQRA